MKVALTVAGSDSSGGAGIQADLKTFQAYNIYGSSAITAVTCQNTLQVLDIQAVNPDIVRKQMIAVLSDIPVNAAKTGMLYSAEIMEAFLEVWRDHKSRTSAIPLVIDPVMISTSGDRLLSAESVDLYFELFGEATIITPNLPELSALLGTGIESVEDVKEAAATLHGRTQANILVKGGHGIRGESDALDIYYNGKEFSEFRSPFIKSKNTHGTGCTLSAAITACLANGMAEKSAIADAKNYVTGAIKQAPGLGSGHGPLNHMWRQKPDP